MGYRCQDRTNSLDPARREERGAAMKGTIHILKHVEDEGPGLLGDFFQKLGWGLVIAELYRGQQPPENLDLAAAVIVLGGPMNVYEEETYPFLKREDDFIRQVLREEIPFLGICLGAQLLAKACGASVTKARHKEIGWFEVSLTAEGQWDPLFRGLGGSVPIFQWHGDTFGVPEGGTLLATGDLCRNQAFRVGSTAYGLQFHAEVTPRMVGEWLEKERAHVDVESIEREGVRFRDHYTAQAGIFLGNFQRIIESSLKGRQGVL